MSSRHLKLSSLLRTLVLCAAVAAPWSALAADLEQQTSQAGGVSVSVKPMDLSAAATTWQFKVALNTHSGALSDDLARSATLVDGAGKPHAALGWDGDAAGGHHRSGVLRFSALSPRPDAVELRIVRAGETAPRTFHWNLK